MSIALAPPVIDDATRREFIALLGAAGLLTACATGICPKAPVARANRIDTVLGPRDIPVDPQRVVAIEGRADLDHVLALDLPVVGYPVTRAFDNVVSPFVVDALRRHAEAEPLFARDEINIEAVAAARPDLIVSRVVEAEELATELGAIAPVLPPCSTPRCSPGFPPSPPAASSPSPRTCGTPRSSPPCSPCPGRSTRPPASSATSSAERSPDHAHTAHPARHRRDPSRVPRPARRCRAARRLRRRGHHPATGAGDPHVRRRHRQPDRGARPRPADRRHSRRQRRRPTALPRRPGDRHRRPGARPDRRRGARRRRDVRGRSRRRGRAAGDRAGGVHRRVPARRRDHGRLRRAARRRCGRPGHRAGRTDRRPHRAAARHSRRPMERGDRGQPALFLRLRAHRRPDRVPRRGDPLRARRDLGRADAGGREPENGGFLGDLSLERLSDFDADLVILSTDDPTFTEQPVVQQLAAVGADQVLSEPDLGAGHYPALIDVADFLLEQLTGRDLRTDLV